MPTTAIATASPDEPDEPKKPTGIWKRMQEASAGLSAREVARRTRMNGETTRRYLRGSVPTIWFVIEFCRAFGVSSDWLLDGIGPRSRPKRG